jgi:hypothetical protein
LLVENRLKYIEKKILAYGHRHPTNGVLCLKEQIFSAWIMILAAFQFELDKQEMSI